MMLLAIVGIQGRLIMNLLDGMVAVEHNKKFAVGGIFNEVPDRVATRSHSLAWDLWRKQCHTVWTWHIWQLR